jgi:hypothetical protein
MSDRTKPLAERVLPVLQAASQHVAGFAYSAEGRDPFDKAGWVVTYDGSETPADIDAVAAAIAAFGCVVPRAVTVAEVVEERARRLARGFDYDFGDQRGVHRIGTTETDMKGWDEVAKASLAALALGTPEAEIHLVTDTGPVTATALEWQQVVATVTGARQAIWHASFALQRLDPIPADYADDRRWG